jgi:histidinol-phosphate/aromatic aminotransferase/cobyric acid decarboxylase-like protein
MDEYIQTENAYINAIKQFINCQDLSALNVYYLEKWNEIDELAEEIARYPEIYPQEMLDAYAAVKQGDVLPLNQIDHICRLALRNLLWGILKIDRKLFVHFGDYYLVYVGASRKCERALEEIADSGLFVEPMQSPYKRVRAR